MEFQIKKLSNEEIDIMSKNGVLPVRPMNSLGIMISYEYFLKLVDLNWYDILFAIENGYLNVESAVEHALKVIEQVEVYEEEVFELASIMKKEIKGKECEIFEILRKLANELPSEIKELTKKKLLYVVLSWLFENQELYEDPFRVIEFIFDDFGFPASIRELVRYMSLPYSKEKIIESQQSQIGDTDLLFKKWIEYLENQKVIFHYPQSNKI